MQAVHSRWSPGSIRETSTVKPWAIALRSERWTCIGGPGVGLHRAPRGSNWEGDPSSDGFGMRPVPALRVQMTSVRTVPPTGADGSVVRHSGR